MSAATTGYRTNASGRLTVVQRGRPMQLEVTLIQVSTDRAVVTIDQSLPVGTSVSLQVENFEMPEIAAKVLANEGNHGTGYRLALKLQNSWPYRVFTALTSMAMGDSDSNSPVKTPPCLSILGLTLPCTAEAVEAAFAIRVRHAHPDRGGDIETFVRLRNAYLEALELLGCSR